MKAYRPKNSERGSAILMTLGVLSIVMVIGMLFLATARNAKTISYAGTDDQRAALNSESAEAFAMAILQEMTQTSTGEGGGTNYRPADSTMTTADDPPKPLVLYKPVEEGDADHQPYIGNFSGAVANFINHADVTAGKYSQNAVFSDFCAHYGVAEKANNRLWGVVKNYSRLAEIAGGALNALDNDNVGFRNVTDNNGEIIGRLGFVILMDGSKFNLNAIVNPYVNNSGRSHSIPVLVKSTKEVDVKGTVGDAALPEMPLGMGSDPNGDAEEGAFVVMGFSPSDPTNPEDANWFEYETVIDEAKTLRYGLHPQELRANSADYATPPGNAPFWNNYLQLQSKVNTFKDADILLYSLTGGDDEPEMVYDGQQSLTYGSPTTPPAKLAKLNLQLPDLKCGTNTKLGWEGLNDHFTEGACISHDTCEWSTKLFRQASILGGLNERIVFQDDDGNEINRHVMANLMDFCDQDDDCTYLINGDGSIHYDNLDTNITKDNIATLAEPGKLICGNELAPAVIGVQFQIACSGGSFRNWYEIKPPPGGETPVQYNKWQMMTQHTLTLTPTISLANIYPQLETGVEYNLTILFKGEVEESYTAAAAAYPDEGLENETNYERTTGFFVTLPVVDGEGNPLPITGPDALKVADVTLPAVVIPLTESFNDLNTTRAGELKTMDSIGCRITDVLIVLHPVDDDSDATLISDIAYFHDDAAAIAPAAYDDFNHTPPEMAVATQGTAIAGGAITPVVAFGGKVNESGEPVEYWTARALACDPRCNDKSSAWELAALPFAKSDTVPTEELGVAAWNNIVANCKCGSGDDQDWEQSLTNISALGDVGNTFSTAYIANEPFTSLWQLGAVHRYDVGQTINLRRYNNDLTIGKYADGDAALLDFCKVTEATNGIKGKFNPNCFNAGSYRYLLKDIPWGEDANDVWIYRPAKANYSRTLGTEDDVDAFLSLGASNNYTDQSWLPVQAFMKFAVPKNGAANDREIESFYGCAAGLLSTRYESFTIITVGQSLQWLEDIEEAFLPSYTAEDKLKKVKELGGVNPTVIDGQWYSVLGTRVQLVTVLRDCWLNKFKIVGRQRL